MLSELEKERYNRHLILEAFGKEAQLKLKAAKILVIGAGGLGSPSLLYLAAAGVGTIGIIDFDSVSLSNLQRQVLFSTGMVGMPKVEKAEERIHSLNPLIKVITWNDRLTARKALEIFPAFDLVIDGTDNFATRYLVNDACTILGKPLIYGSIFRFQGQVSVFNYNNGPTYRCLFPEPPDPLQSPDCSQAGVLGVLPGIIGCHQALEAIKVITGVGETLSGKILLIDTLKNTFNTFSLSKNPEAIARAPKEQEEFLKFDYSYFCGLSGNNDISNEQFFEMLEREKNLQVIDVREIDEKPEITAFHAQKIPLSLLKEKLEDIDNHKPTVLICKSGIRSQKALNILKEEGFLKLYNLKGGVDNLDN
jgi:sulfur-carrier protein adenylyltransferase/sulfurtransferase